MAEFDEEVLVEEGRKPPPPPPPTMEGNGKKPPPPPPPSDSIMADGSATKPVEEMPKEQPSGFAMDMQALKTQKPFASQAPTQEESDLKSAISDALIKHNPKALNDLGIETNKLKDLKLPKQVGDKIEQVAINPPDINDNLLSSSNYVKGLTDQIAAKYPQYAKDIEGYVQGLNEQKTNVRQSMKQIATKPNDPNGYYDLASAKLQTGDLDEAQKGFMASLSVAQKAAQDPSLGKEKFDELQRSANKSLQGLGFVAMKQGDYKTSTEIYGQLANENPTPDILSNLSYSLYQTGDIEGAGMVIQKAINKNPNEASPNALRVRGIINTAAGLTEQGLADTKQSAINYAMQIDPPHVGESEREKELASLGQSLNAFVDKAHEMIQSVARAAAPEVAIGYAIAEGIEGTIEGFKSIPKAYEEGGATSAAATGLATGVRATMVGMTAFNPQMQQFVSAMAKAEAILPSELLAPIMQPASMAMDINANSTHLEKSVAEIGDLIGSILIFESAKGVGKLGYKEAVRLKEKISNNEPLSKEEAETVVNTFQQADPAILNAIDKNIAQHGTINLEKKAVGELLAASHESLGQGAITNEIEGEPFVKPDLSVKATIPSPPITEPANKSLAGVKQEGDVTPLIEDIGGETKSEVANVSNAVEPKNDAATSETEHRQNIHDKFRKEFKAKGVNDEQITGALALLDARAKSWASEEKGRTPEQYYQKIADVKSGEFQTETPKQYQMPDGSKVMGVPTSPEVVNGFYSPIEKNLLETKLENKSAAAWLQQLGKGDEVTFTGLKEFLSSKKPNEQVKKSEILDYLKNNRIQIVEVVKGGELTKSDLEKEGFIFTKEDGKHVITPPKKYENDLGFVNVAHENLQSAIDAVAQSMEGVIGKDNTKFSQYQEPGDKSNYKEVLITMPVENKLPEGWTVRKRDNITEGTKDRPFGVYDAEGKMQYTAASEERAKALLREYEKTEPTKFQSSHFDEPNILAHLRMNTRTDAEGKKTLFIEEVQSDWGQKGKKEGFKENLEPLHAKEKELRNKSVVILKKYNFYDPDVNFEYYSDNPIDTVNRIAAKNPNADLNELGDLQLALKQFDDLQQKLVKEYQKSTPTAPFVTDTNAWTKLSLKVALKEAVKQGEQMQRSAWDKMMTEKELWIEERMKKLGKLRIDC